LKRFSLVCLIFLALLVSGCGSIVYMAGPGDPTNSGWQEGVVINPTDLDVWFIPGNFKMLMGVRDSTEPVSRISSSWRPMRVRICLLPHYLKPGRTSCTSVRLFCSPILVARKCRISIGSSSSAVTARLTTRIRSSSTPGRTTLTAVCTTGLSSPMNVAGERQQQNQAPGPSRSPGVCLFKINHLATNSFYQPGRDG